MQHGASSVQCARDSAAASTSVYIAGAPTAVFHESIAFYMIVQKSAQTRRARLDAMLGGAQSRMDFAGAERRDVSSR